MRLVASLVGLIGVLASAAAGAQESPRPTAAQIADFLAVADAALAEGRLYLNCSATGANAEYFVQAWDTGIERTREVLEKAGVLSVHVNGFLERAAADALLMPEARFGDVIATCRTNRSSLEAFDRFEMISPASEARRIFGVE